MPCSENDFCCVQTSGNGCYGVGSTCAGAKVSCTGGCGTEVCCGTRSTASLVVQCQTDCHNGVLFCNPQNVSKDCATLPGTSCAPYTGLPGFYVCQ